MVGDLHCHTKLSDGSLGIEDIVDIDRILDDSNGERSGVLCGTEYTSSDGYHDGCDGYIDSDIYRFEPEFWSRWLGGIVVRRDGDAGVCDYGILSSL